MAEDDFTLDDEHVHRPELVSALSGVPRGAPITPEVVARVLAHVSGGRKGVPAGARVVVVSNQAQADKVFQALDTLPGLELLVSFESVAVPAGVRLAHLSWHRLMHSGWRHGSFAAGLIGKPDAASSSWRLPT